MAGQRFAVFTPESDISKPKTLDARFRAIAAGREAAQRLEAQRSTAAASLAQRREAAEARQSQARIQTLTAHRQVVNSRIPSAGTSLLAGRLRPATLIPQANPFPPVVRGSGVRGRIGLPVRGRGLPLRGRAMAGMFGLGPTRGVIIRGGPRGKRGVARGVGAIRGGRRGRGR